MADALQHGLVFEHALAPAETQHLPEDPQAHHAAAAGPEAAPALADGDAAAAAAAEGKRGLGERCRGCARLQGGCIAAHELE